MTRCIRKSQTWHSADKQDHTLSLCRRNQNKYGYGWHSMFLHVYQVYGTIFVADSPVPIILGTEHKLGPDVADAALLDREDRITCKEKIDESAQQDWAERPRNVEKKSDSKSWTELNKTWVLMYHATCDKRRWKTMRMGCSPACLRNVY